MTSWRQFKTFYIWLLVLKDLNRRISGWKLVSSLTQFQEKRCKKNAKFRIKLIHFLTGFVTTSNAHLVRHLRFKASATCAKSVPTTTCVLSVRISLIISTPFSRSEKNPTQNVQSNSLLSNCKPCRKRWTDRITSKRPALNLWWRSTTFVATRKRLLQ